MNMKCKFIMMLSTFFFIMACLEKTNERKRIHDPVRNEQKEKQNQKERDKTLKLVDAAVDVERYGNHGSLRLSAYVAAGDEFVSYQIKRQEDGSLIREGQFTLTPAVIHNLPMGNYKVTFKQCRYLTEDFSDNHVACGEVASKYYKQKENRNLQLTEVLNKRQQLVDSNVEQAHEINMIINKYRGNNKELNLQNQDDTITELLKVNYPPQVLAEFLSGTSLQIAQNAVQSQMGNSFSLTEGDGKDKDGSDGKGEDGDDDEMFSITNGAAVVTLLATLTSKYFNMPKADVSLFKMKIDGAHEQIKIWRQAQNDAIALKNVGDNSKELASKMQTINARIKRAQTLAEKELFGNTLDEAAAKANQPSSRWSTLKTIGLYTVVGVAVLVLISNVDENLVKKITDAAGKLGLTSNSSHGIMAEFAKIEKELVEKNLQIKKLEDHLDGLL